MNIYHNVAVTNVPILVSDKSVDLLGYRVEENDNNAAFLQFFNAEQVSDITLGTTVADWELRIVANSNEQRDPSLALPLRKFSKGLVVAMTTATNGATVLGTAASLTLWYNRNA